MKNRIPSNITSLFVQTGESFYTTTDIPQGDILKFLPLAQDASFTINTQSNRASIAEIGNKRRVAASYQLVPEPEFSFSYFASNFFIEEGFGFYKTTNGDTNTLDFTDNNQPFSGDAEFNVYFLVSEDEGSDLVSDRPQTAGENAGGLSGYYSVGFGNCQITSFDLSASVGELPVASVNGRGAHSSVERLVTGSVTLPSVNLSSGHRDGVSSGVIQYESFEDRTGLGVIRPGGISLNINAPWEIGGPDLDSLCVQDVGLSVDLSRKSLFGFGKHFLQGRELGYPINGKLSINSVVSDFDSGNLSGLISGLAISDGSTVSITMSTIDNKTGVVQIGSEDFPLTLDSINYNIGVNNELFTDIVYSFDLP